MAGVKLEWAQFGDFDSFAIYRAEQPIDTIQLPEPLISGLKKGIFWDEQVEDAKTYYYCIATLLDGETALSDQISIYASDAFTAPYNLKAIFNSDDWTKPYNVKATYSE